VIVLLFLGLIIFAVVCLWILIDRRKSPKFLIWFIPLFLFFTISLHETYTSLLGQPRMSIPEKGLYLSHYVDEPKWIYLWVANMDNVPTNYQLPYSKETHKSLEGVKGEAEKGEYMMLEVDSEKGDMDGENEKEGEEANGFTVGGDVSFYKWDFKSSMTTKDGT